MWQSRVPVAETLRGGYHSGSHPACMTLGPVNMKIRRSVFGSEGEKALYKSLVSNWSRTFSLYPSLPFASIIDDLRESDPTESQINFLYKTSVDYTLCTKLGKPILSIEFDGLGDGFSRASEYIMKRPFPNDPNREWKLGLKLRVCQELLYPFFVVSYEESRPLGPDLHLTIVDGIVGQVLANREFPQLVHELGEEYRDSIDELPPDERDEFIQDYVIIGAEVEAALKWDPIAREAAKYKGAVVRQRIAQGWSHEYLTDPALPPLRGSFPALDAGSVRKRIEAREMAEYVGVRVTVQMEPTPIAQTAWVRNIEGMGVSPLMLAENIAELLTFKRVVEIKRADAP